MRTPAWLPDWKDPASYATKRVLIEWRWEFLRRRAEYQAAWMEWRERESAVLRKHPNLLRTIRRTSPRTAESVAKWWDDRNDALEKVNALCGTIEMLRPFALRQFIDPAQAYSPEDLDSAFKHPDWGGVLDLKEGEATEHYRRGVVIVAFDVRFDINQQLRDTKQMLQVERRTLGIEAPNQRMHPARWPTYLRILDAKACGASLTTIARKLGLASGGNAADVKSRVHEMADAAAGVQIKLTS